MDKSHIQHPVGFVQNKIFQCVQADKTLIDQIQQTPGSCDQYVYTPFQCICLWLLPHATENNGMFYVSITPVCRKTFTYLDRQFACRSQDQGFDARFTSPRNPLFDLLDDRDGESCRLTCSGLCAT